MTGAQYLSQYLFLYLSYSETSQYGEPTNTKVTGAPDEDEAAVEERRGNSTERFEFNFDQVWSK